MRYLTNGTYSKLSREISNEITTDELAKYIKYEVFFLSKKDRKFLWKLAELFGNEKAIKIINEEDNKSWVIPPSSPKYHTDKKCKALGADAGSFIICSSLSTMNSDLTNRSSVAFGV